MPNDRPRVLVAIKGLGIGGAEKLISEGARYWDRDRYDYHVAYALPWKDQLVSEIEALGIEVTCVGGPKGSTAATWRGLRRLVRDLDPALVHAHSPMIGVMARFLPVRLVYTEHNVASSYREPTRTANRLTYGRNRRVIAVSQPVAESLQSFRGPAPVVVVNGVAVAVDADTAAAARAELNLDDGQQLYVHVGNIRPHKGHSNLIAAAALLADRAADIQIVSIGGEKVDGDLDRVRDEAVNAGADGVLRFLGRRPDALAFVAAADGFVNPADVEGLPVAVLEAMNLEKPIVATAVGGVPDIIHDEKTGLLVEPRDPVTLAAAIARLVDDRSLAASLAANARELVERDFSLEAMVKANEAQYELALGD